MESTETKVCSKCGLEKPISEFYFHKRDNRYIPRCRKCLAEQAAVYYNRDLEASRARCNSRNAKNRKKRNEQALANKKRYKLNNPKRFLIEGARYRAGQKGLTFDITDDEIDIPQVCPVLGIPLFFSTDGRPTDNSPSLDRIDNSKGYVKGNVMVISYRANRLKNDATLEEVEKILHYIRGLTKLKHPL